MLQIKDRQRVPPGHYTYACPHCGFVFRARVFARLVAEVRSHRIANNLPLGDNFAKELEQAWCDEHPDWCEEDPKSAPPLAVQASNFAKSMWRWGKSGFAMVDQATFDKRSATCQKPCEHWKGWKELGVGRCKLCGCAAGTVSLKLWMATEKCPDKPPRW